MTRTKLIVLIWTIAAVGSGCGPGGSPTPNPPPGPVTVLSPQAGETFSVNETVSVQLQGASFTGIQQFEVKTSDGQSWYAGPTSSESGGAEYGTLFYGEITWIPDTPGTYTLQARATNAALLSGPWTEIQVVVLDYLAAPAVAETPAVVQISPSPTPTSSFWQASAVMNANCRAGPGTTFNETGFVPKGSTVEIVGRNEAETWLNVVNPNGDGFCWASIIAFEIPFEMSVLPIKASDPAPPAPSSGGEGGGGPAPQGCIVTDPLTGQKQCKSPCPPRAAPGGACTP